MHGISLRRSPQCARSGYSAQVSGFREVDPPAIPASQNAQPGVQGRPLGSRAAALSRTAAVSLPNRTDINEVQYQDGFGQQMQLILRGERIDSTASGQADSCSARSFFE